VGVLLVLEFVMYLGCLYDFVVLSFCFCFLIDGLLGLFGVESGGGGFVFFLFSCSFVFFLFFFILLVRFVGWVCLGLGIFLCEFVLYCILSLICGLIVIWVCMCIIGIDMCGFTLVVVL
jgi:hypothetical protein